MNDEGWLRCWACCVMSYIGHLEGLSPFGKSLATWEWASSATGDSKTWFFGNKEAREEAIWEIRRQRRELAFDIGARKCGVVALDLKTGQVKSTSEQEAKPKLTPRTPHRWACLLLHDGCQTCAECIDDQTL